MVDRAAVVLALLAPVLVLATYQGMLTAGLVPLAVFGPIYAAARYASGEASQARTESARLTAAATVGAALALVPALAFLDVDPTTVPARLTGLGLGLTAAGAGTLAGLAATPPPRRLSRDEKRRWTLVEMLDHEHARGLVTLFLVAVPAAIGIGLLREAALFGTGTDTTGLPGALFGDRVLGGRLVLPNPTSNLVVALPLSLAPLAIGFLTSPRRATPLALGGLGVLAITPLAIAFDLPVETSGGALVPLPLRVTPGFDALAALAPVGAGIVLGAGLVHGARHVRQTQLLRRALWAASAALVVLLLDGLLPAVVLLIGIACAALVVSWRARQAPLGTALVLGAVTGTVAGMLGSVGTGLALGTVVGIVAGSAALAATASRNLVLPEEAVRSPRTLAYLLIGISLGGAIVWAGASALAAGDAPFTAPHARGLVSALEALITSRGDLLLVWGLAAGGLIQWSLGRGALVGLGFLIGPGAALMVFLGSMLRALWENLLLDRAREGFVMRGELGYELMRAHVVVVAVLAGEAVAVAIGPLIG